ncbi:MAG: hypothetical protein AAF617_13010 [Bacteroidota bacterium]
MGLTKTTNEKATYFLQNYRKSDYENLVVQIDNQNDEDDPFAEYKKIVNKSIAALSDINQLARDVLDDIRPVLIKYNSLLTILQIVTVLSSAGTLILFYAKTQENATIITAFLTLIAAVGNVVAKGFIKPLFGGGLDRQALSDNLIKLWDESVTTKGMLENIVFDDSAIPEIKRLLSESTRIIGDMEAMLLRLKDK